MKKSLLALYFIFGICSSIMTKPPSLTVVIILDQGAYHFFPKLKHHLTGGIKQMMKQATFYQRAYFPHGIPETTPGHHTLSTAVLPKDHGAITNQWIHPETYEKIIYEETTINGNRQESSQRTMIDGLSDQFILHSPLGKKHKSIALSIKDHPAISMAHQLGKAVWFNTKTGKMDSTPSFYKTLPNWAAKTNAEDYLTTASHFSWKLAYPDNKAAYDFPFANDYRFAGYDFVMAGNEAIPIKNNKSNAYEYFSKAPQASQMLLDVALSCVEEESADGSSLLLWISLSNFDLAGHIYGPDSKEHIDLFYHIDKQLGAFFKKLTHHVDPSNLLIVFTADHGIAPIPEITQAKGYSKAHRLVADELIKTLNNDLINKCKLQQNDHIIMKYEPTSFTLNKKILRSKKRSERTKIEKTLCNLLKQRPGIKNAWRADDLKQLSLQEKDLEQFYKNQLYYERSGDIIIQPSPYCLITNYPKGTSHMTPYEYDTHVPLMIYRKGRITHNVIHEKVYMPQLPITLAHLLNIDIPSASTYDPLPGIPYNPDGS